jgi:hypothetical protein
MKSAARFEPRFFMRERKGVLDLAARAAEFRAVLVNPNLGLVLRAEIADMLVPAIALQDQFVAAVFKLFDAERRIRLFRIQFLRV